jgi:hypothetical protein
MKILIKRLVRVFSALALGLAVCLPHASADFVDCKICHLPIDPTSTVPDFTVYYNNPTHHPTGVMYPAIIDSNTRFNSTTGLTPGIVFFDTNHNGIADADEIQLFGALGLATVECASCHIEHGTVPPPAGTPPSLYLRVNNTNSSLCFICHKM